MSVPRTIWTVWLQGRENAPPLVRACLDSWERMNPEWDFRFLRREDLDEHLDLEARIWDTVSEMSPNHLSDLARINLLRQYGGVWVDATCLCMVPLDNWIHEYAKSGFFAFSKPRPDRLISSWFLASERNCPLTARYCSVVNSYCAANDFRGIKSNRIAGYAAELARRYIGDNPWLSALYASPLFAHWVGATRYFWFHYAFAHTLLTSRDARQVWEVTPTVSSDFSSGDGPHALQKHGMFEEVSESLRDRVAAREDPLYKLNWKKSAEQNFDLSEADPQYAVKYVMREVGVQSVTT